MASEKRHPYLRKEFWEKNTFWRNESHGKHEVYEEMYQNIMKTFYHKEDNITTKIK
jgi:hypothetical protein